MTGIFVTATGTDIGKTYVTCQLLACDAQNARVLSASKPIISGWPPDEKDIQQTDTGRLLQAMGLPCSLALINKISPWRFSAPLTPSMAAQKAGKEIVIKDLIAYSHQLLDIYPQQMISRLGGERSSNPTPLRSYVGKANLVLRSLGEAGNTEDSSVKGIKIHLLEGVGGVMAPIWQEFTVIDWIQSLGCAAILVAGSYLGTLSHTLTAIRCLQTAGIPIVAVVINESEDSPVSLAETATYFRSHLEPLAVFTLPREATHQTVLPLYHYLLKSFETKLTL